MTWGPVPGVSASSGVKLSAQAIAFLGELRRVCPLAVPIHVTSGIRSSRAQAEAMLKKVAAGEDLTRLYGTKVRQLLLLPATLEVWTATIDTLAQSGVYMSRHLRGDAVDLRVNGLTPQQVASLQQCVRALGGRVLMESKPTPHMHVDVPATITPGVPSPDGSAPGGGPAPGDGGVLALSLLAVVAVGSVVLLGAPAAFAVVKTGVWRLL